MNQAEKDFQAACIRHKAALTKARGTKDPKKIKAAAQAALNYFETSGLYPDNWHLYQVAVEDANYNISHPKDW